MLMLIKDGRRHELLKICDNSTRMNSTRRSDVAVIPGEDVGEKNSALPKSSLALFEERMEIDALFYWLHITSIAEGILVF
jgi:hypothetical protein